MADRIDQLQGVADAIPNSMTYKGAFDFINGFKHLSQACYQNAQDKGFYDKPVDDGTRLMLMVTELAEACEALRHGNPPDDHIPEFSGAEAELADVIIRILDFSAYKNLDVGQAVITKMGYNANRKRMHGGKSF